MIKNILAAILIFASVGIVEAKGATLKRIDLYAQQRQSGTADLTACGNAYGGSFLETSNRLNKKMLMLIELSGYDTDAFAEGQNRKIEAFSYMYKYGSPEQDTCRMHAKFAADQETNLDADLKKLRSKKTVRSSSSSDCPLPADHYRDRFKSSGNIADLTCFQKSGLRELNAASQ